MENDLQGFQVDLSGISNEIKFLQDEGVALSVRLHNRREVEKRLHKFLDKIIVPDKLIIGILQGPVDETYLDLLRTLDGKITYVNSTSSIEPPTMKSTAPPALSRSSTTFSEETITSTEGDGEGGDDADKEDSGLTGEEEEAKSAFDNIAERNCCRAGRPAPARKAEDEGNCEDPGISPRHDCRAQAT